MHPVQLEVPAVKSAAAPHWVLPAKLVVILHETVLEACIVGTQLSIGNLGLVQSA